MQTLPELLQQVQTTMTPPNTDLSPFIDNQVGKGKTILITGASSGLGAGMATHFARMGYNLAICARRTERLEQLKANLLADNPTIKVSVKALDVTDYTQVFKVFHEFAQEFGKLDRIINAGVGEGRRIGKGNFEINRKTAEINFISGLAQCEAAMEIFRAQNSGHLVVISSMSAFRGLPKHYMSVYAASKSAIAQLAEGIRADMLLSELPIKVSTIYPGIYALRLTKALNHYPLK